MLKLFLAIFFGALFLINTKSVYAAPKINELYAAGDSSSNPDWVEVYLQGDTITEYQLQDESGNTKDFSAASCSGNYCTVDWSNRLNSGGDTIKLILTLSSSTVDEVAYGSSTGNVVDAPTSGQSAGRTTDGTGSWALFSIPTKGSTNNSSTPVPSPTATPTPTPTQTATSTPTATPTSTPSPTKSPTPKPTKSPTPTPFSTPEELVLGVQNDEATPVPLPTESPKPSFLSSLTKGKSPLALGMMTVGVGFLGVAGFSFIKGRGLKQGQSFDTIDSSDADN